MIANETRDKKQQKMIEDIWNAPKAKGEIVEEVERVEGEEEKPEPSTAIMPKDNCERGKEFERIEGEEEKHELSTAPMEDAEEA